MNKRNLKGPELKKIKIVFVCLGNYCRSPMAEAILNTMVKREGLNARFDITSAGTENWDVGLPPDHRSAKLLQEHNYHLDPSKRAKLISANEIQNADYLVAMTTKIANALGNQDNVYLLMDFIDNPVSKDIPDPYPTDTFPQAFSMIEKGVRAFYSFLKDKYSLS